MFDKDEVKEEVTVKVEDTERKEEGALSPDDALRKDVMDLVKQANAVTLKRMKEAYSRDDDKKVEKDGAEEAMVDRFKKLGTNRVTAMNAARRGTPSFVADQEAKGKDVDVGKDSA
jgi:hypothetical protein